MDTIPQDLIRSLRRLGLLESEAKLYITLVLMNNAEVTGLIDSLGFSKPSTYQSLRELEHKGLIVQISEKPITYQAVPPDIGLEILIDAFAQAKEDAKKYLSTLKRGPLIGKVATESPDSLWFVFNKKNIEYKIRNMLQNAERSIFLIASDQYIRYFTPLANTDLDLDIIVFSKNPKIEQSLKKTFKSDRATVHVVSTVELVKLLSKIDSLLQEEFMQPLEETLLMLNFDNMLFVIVDDAEILSTPPLSGDSPLAFNFRDARAIANMRLQYKDVHHK